MNPVILPTRAWLVDKGDVTQLMIEGTCAGQPIVAVLATTELHGDTQFTRDALEQMRDQINADAARHKKHEPAPAFLCESCGGVAYFQGIFSAARFEEQERAFKKKHGRCLPTFNGGCI